MSKSPSPSRNKKRENSSPAPASPSSPKRAKAEATLQETLVALERETWERTANGDWEFYQDLMIDGGYAVFPDGVFSKEDSVNFTKTGPKVQREFFDFSEVKVIEVTPTDAILIYKVVAKQVGKPKETSFCSTVFTKRAGKWKVAATHWMKATNQE
jgi:hypothetical protein